MSCEMPRVWNLLLVSERFHSFFGLFRHLIYISFVRRELSLKIAQRGHCLQMVSLNMWLYVLFFFKTLSVCLFLSFERNRETDKQDEYLTIRKPERFLNAEGHFTLCVLLFFPQYLHAEQLSHRNIYFCKCFQITHLVFIINIVI